MNGISSWMRYTLPYIPYFQRVIADYAKPNGMSQKTIRKRLRYIRSQHQKRNRGRFA